MNRRQRRALISQGKMARAKKKAEVRKIVFPNGSSIAIGEVTDKLVGMNGVWQEIPGTRITADSIEELNEVLNNGVPE